MLKSKRLTEGEGGGGGNDMIKTALDFMKRCLRRVTPHGLIL